MKKRIHFHFQMPLIRMEEGKVKDPVTVDITGDAYHFPGEIEDPFQVDIDFVEYKGMNIKPLLDTYAFEGAREQIYQAADSHALYLFRQARATA